MKYLGSVHSIFFLMFIVIFPIELHTISQITAFQEYFLANYDSLLENTAQAAERFEFLLRSNPTPAIFPGVAEYLFTTKQYGRLNSFAPLIDTHLPLHQPTQLLILQSLAAEQNISAHNKKLLQLQSRFQKEPEFAIYATEWYIRTGQIREALAFIDQFILDAQSSQKLFMFHYLKAQLLITTGKHEIARESAQESVKLAPHFGQGWLLLGLVHEMCGRPNEALASFRQCREKMGPNTYIDQQILTLEKMTKTDKAP